MVTLQVALPPLRDATASPDSLTVLPITPVLGLISMTTALAWHPIRVDVGIDEEIVIVKVMTNLPVVGVVAASSSSFSTDL